MHEMYDRVSIETYETDQKENIFHPQATANDDKLSVEYENNLARERSNSQSELVQV